MAIGAVNDSAGGLPIQPDAPSAASVEQVAESSQAGYFTPEDKVILSRTTTKEVKKKKHGDKEPRRQDDAGAEKKSAPSQEKRAIQRILEWITAPDPSNAQESRTAADSAI
jgi:hypothetical protein